MKYLHMRLDELMQEKSLSRNRVCKDLDLQSTNQNSYYRNEIHRLYAELIVRLCEYLDCSISDLLVIQDEPEDPQP